MYQIDTKKRGDNTTTNTQKEPGEEKTISNNTGQRARVCALTDAEPELSVAAEASPVAAPAAPVAAPAAAADARISSSMSWSNPSSTMARNELVLGFRTAATLLPAGAAEPSAATLLAAAAAATTAAGGAGGDDGDDSDEGQSSAPAVDGDVVEGLGGACSGAQAGMIIGRAMREAFRGPIEPFFPPRGGLVSEAAADAGGVTPSVVRFLGGSSAGPFLLPLVSLPLALRRAA